MFFTKPQFLNNTMSQNYEIVRKQLIFYFHIISDILSTQFRNSIYIYKKSGIFFEPSSSQEINYVSNMSIKMLSFNIDDLACHRHKYPSNRVTEIIDFLKSTKADIICLQEVWGEPMKQEISDAFLANNFYVALPSWQKKYYFGENSGLMVLSKYPIISQTFVPFTNSRGICRLANKGVQYCHIRIPNTDPKTSFELNIANTHLQTSLVEFNKRLDYQDAAKQQLRTIISECPYESCILVGDLNITREQMDDFIKNEQNIDYFGPNEKNTYPNYDDRLDYFLKIEKLNTLTKTVAERNSVRTGIDLSDHYPIECEFTIESPESSPEPKPSDTAQC